MDFKNRTEVVCDGCKNKFLKINSRVSKLNFCCFECKVKWGKHQSICNNCNKNIFITRYQLINFKKHFCNKFCESQYNVGSRNPNYKGIKKYCCDNCGKEIERYVISKFKHHFCSKNCANDGKFNPAYIHGESDSMKYGPEFFNIRSKLKGKLFCAECGKSRVQLHHIDYNKNNNNFSNLLPLCINCHTKTNCKNRTMWTNKYKEPYYQKRTLSGLGFGC